MESERRLETYLTEAEDRIDWVLAHPGMSDWLKETLRGACERDPVEVLNDLEMLDHLLRRRAQAQIERSLSRIGHESGGLEQTKEKQG
ncbi:MAG: hypothetical protein HLUCCA12_17540 [Rhodobacteraceae bacterium HLUCCA12]|nr:MAG: hypothetical protein HLUCCA12_17540 [Rhodobacteraceae bacterium HLUCCA12]